MLEVSKLTVEFETRYGKATVLEDFSCHVGGGEILGIVGESGSGKSVSMLSVMGLLGRNGNVRAGHISLDGLDISPPRAADTPAQKKAYEDRIRTVRGNRMSMVFQDPMSYLNPLMKIRHQITEAMQVHGCRPQDALNRAAELLRLVGISNPQERLDQYPFELSGGMRQRIIFAIALSCDPKLLIADEPTTALDVTIQAQVLELLKEVCRKRKMSVVMITHDLGVVAALCSKITVLYGGRVLEEGLIDEIFYDAKHPYTRGLLGSVRRMEPIPGSPPDLLNLSSGCAFYPRCTKAMNICRDFRPYVSAFSGTHRARCWIYCKDKAICALKEGAFHI